MKMIIVKIFIIITQCTIVIVSGMYAVLQFSLLKLSLSKIDCKLNFTFECNAYISNPINLNVCHNTEEIIYCYIAIWLFVIREYLSVVKIELIVFESESNQISSKDLLKFACLVIKN